MTTKPPTFPVIKRDGRVVNFDLAKINLAISKALAETKEFSATDTGRLAEIVANLVEKSLKPTSQDPTNVEQIQDIVEQVLMAAGYYQTAKAYILYREQHRKERAIRAVIGVEDDLGLSLNQLKVLESRYLLHDEDGRVIETPSQMFNRVAKTLASVEKADKKNWTKRFYEVMSNMEFLPAGRTLNNAGTPQNQLANCFVLPIEDSMEGIFDSVKWTALVHQTGGGTGFNFSRLRPSGDLVSKSSGGYATGPVSFMKVFDVATRQVMQGGKKRGANMGILNINHPDIIEFITCKTEEGEIANFNISIGMTDEFMQAVKDNKNFSLKNPRTGEITQTLRASTLMDQIATLSWRTGDPGMIYLDAINRNNPLIDSLGPIDTTNPCGEQPLHPFDACNLGSINLAKFVTSDSSREKRDKTKKGESPVARRSSLIDWPRLKQVTTIAVRMLDNVIDAGQYPLPQITQTVKANRRIGLGVMGWADLLFKLNIPYNSNKAVTLAKKVMQFIQVSSWEASKQLATEKGTFPRWSESSFAKGWNPLTKKLPHSLATQLPDSELWKVRNVAITTIAPTGTISMVADTSSGIEPTFALAFVKNVVDEGGLTYVNQWFAKKLRATVGTNGVYNSLISAVGQNGSAQHVDKMPENLKQIFVTAHDIDWQWHIKMQAAFQEFTDNAVSKTINLPNSTSIEDIKSAYLLSWEMGCKGITVYRDGSKDFQVLQTKSPLVRRSHGEGGTKPMIQSLMKQKTLKQRSQQSQVANHQSLICPECNATTTLTEGCVLCHNCGWSACSS